MHLHPCARRVEIQNSTRAPMPLAPSGRQAGTAGIIRAPASGEGV